MYKGVNEQQIVVLWANENIYMRTTHEGYGGVDLSQPLEDIFIVRILGLYREREWIAISL